ncbi:MAG: autoinducer binding domain-containing protein [Massilia sp.]
MVELGQLVTLLKSDSEASWQTALFKLARSQGFDQVLYGAVGSKHAKLENAFLQSNYSPVWRARYDADKLHYVDPTVSHCLGSSLPIVWEPETFRSPDQQALYEEACGHGIRSGITFPVHGPNGEFGVISFASDAKADSDMEDTIGMLMPSLSLIRDYAFESSLRFINARSSTEEVPRLTKRELEVLNWVMVGKSSWEISKITACSEATVNFHIGNIRQKFNVNTRQQALVKAISLGILTPEDPHR